MDAVMRRYLDIIYKYVLQQPVPERKPLFLASDPVEEDKGTAVEEEPDEDGPPRKKRKKSEKKNQTSDPNLTAMQAHMFQMLRPLITKHTHIRDALARSRSGDITGFERVLTMVEQVTKEGLISYEKSSGETDQVFLTLPKDDVRTSSKTAMDRCRRPWWVCQPYIRPLPDEALAKGALQISNKDKRKQENGEAEVKAVDTENDAKEEANTNGSIELVKDDAGVVKAELPKEGMVCG
jgi:tRNA-dihydrouridine synthase 1